MGSTNGKIGGDYSIHPNVSHSIEPKSMNKKEDYPAELDGLRAAGETAI